MTVKQANNDYSTYSFFINNTGAWQSEVDHYSAAGTLMGSASSSWDTSIPCTGEGCTGSDYIKLQRVVSTIGNLSKKTEYAYDSTQLPNLQSVKEWDFVSGSSFPTVPDRETDFNYKKDSTYTDLNILNLVSSKVVKDKSGNKIAGADLTYDEPSLVDAAGAPGHDDTDFGSGRTVRGNVTTVTQWVDASNSITTHQTYDTLGNVRTSTDGKGNSTQYGYSANGGFLQTTTPPATNSVSHVTTLAYDAPTSLLTSVTDENNQVTSYGYTTDGRLSSITYPPGGGSQTISYSSDTKTVHTSRSIQGGGSRETYSVADDFGRPRRVSTSSAATSNDQTDTCYDPNGRVQFTSYPYRGSTGDAYVCSGNGDSFSYDALGRLTAQTHSDSTQVSISYTGRAKQITEENNGSTSRQRVLQYNGFGQVVSACEVASATLVGTDAAPAACGQDIAATGFLTSYTHDGLGNLTGVQQGSSQARTFTFDGLSRLRTATDPESGTTTYTYDANSNVWTRVRPKQNQTDVANKVTTTYAYDALNRPTSVTYDDGLTSTVTNTYDSGSPFAETVQNASGRLIKSEAGSISVGYSYDVLGRVTTNWQAVSQTRKLQYGYDYDGNITSATDSFGNTLTYSYNVAGQPTKLTGSPTDDNHPSILFDLATYNAFGALSQAKIGPKVTRTADYNGRGMLTSLVDRTTGTDAAGSTGYVEIAGNPRSTQVMYQAAVAATGSVTIGGSENSTQVQTQPATQSSGSFTVQGSVQVAYPDTCGAAAPSTSDVGTEISFQQLQQKVIPNSPVCPPVYDSGSLTVTVNGFSVTYSYSRYTTAASLASALASSFNNNPSSPVMASVSSATVTLVSKASGASVNYYVTYSANTYNPDLFSYASFSISPGSFNLAGGRDATYTTVYDAGTATISVNGHSNSASWGQGSSASSIASALASAINSDGAAYVTAGASGTTVNLTSKQTGTSSNSYSLGASVSWDASHFGSGSFATSPSGGTLVGGRDAGYNTVYDTGYVAVAVNGLSKQVGYDQNSSSAGLASALASAFNSDANSPVIANASGSRLTMSSKGTGLITNYSLSANSQTQNSNFSGTAFPATASGSTMTGGKDSNYPYQYTVTRAANGNVKAVNDSVNGNLTFGYDAFNRLTSMSGSKSDTYGYDRYGNRWNKGTGPSLTFGADNRIVSASSFAYDAAGNILWDGFYSYCYDAENRLLRAVDDSNGAANPCDTSKPAVGMYSYDPNGLRVKATINGSTYDYVYDLAGHQIAQWDATNGRTRGEVYLGSMHVATFTPTETYFLHTDQVGTLRALTTHDGTVASKCPSSPWGDGFSCNTPVKTLFTDYERDGETGLDHSWFRQYSPRAGRYHSPDPVLGDVEEPQTWNRYQYGLNSPTSVTDPLGLSEDGSCWFRFNVNGSGFFVPCGLESLAACFFGNCSPRTRQSGSSDEQEWVPQCESDGYRDATVDESSRVLEKAKKLEGMKYWSGAGAKSYPPDATKGVDCSGLVLCAMRGAGIQYSYSPTSTISKNPAFRVMGKKDSLRAGDIVLFSGHVGLYDPKPATPGETIFSARSGLGKVASGQPSYFGKTLANLRIRVKCK